MSRLTTITPRFVEFVPKELEDGVIFISIPYSTSVHRCACGCGSKITLPINPAKWRLLWDGERISLWPSVGNWSYACKSHYWIEQNRIQWSRTLSPERIQAIRERDKAARERYLQAGVDTVDEDRGPGDEKSGLIDRIGGLFRR